MSACRVVLAGSDGMYQQFDLQYRLFKIDFLCQLMYINAFNFQKEDQGFLDQNCRAL